MIKLVNIAVRKDGRVENDTFMTETDDLEKLAKDISERLNADVVLCLIGHFEPLTEEEQQKKSYFVKMEVLENDEI